MTTSRDSDRVWKALADGTRRRILDRLALAPAKTGEICATFPELSRTAVMKHMDVLVAAGLVLVRRDGRCRWNYLNPVPIQRVCDRWVASHVRDMARTLARFAEHVEETSPEREGASCR